MKLLILIIIFSPVILNAQIKSKNNRLQKMNVKFKKSLEKNVQRFDSFRSNIKSRWHEMNKDVDKFFASENYEDELNESYIRINYVMEHDDGGQFSNEFNLRLQTDFPNASKNVKLVIEKESDDLGGDNAGAGIGNSDLSGVNNGQTAENDFEDSRYSAAGRVNWLKSKKWRLYTDIGLRFDVPLDPFIKLRLRRRFQWSKSKLDLIQKIEYFRIDELLHETMAEYLYSISTLLKFKFANSISYERNDGFYEFYNSLAILQKLKRTTSFAYAITASGASEPAISYNTYSYSTSMRRLIRQDWLFLQFTVGVKFPRSEDFDTKGFSLLAFEAFF